MELGVAWSMLLHGACCDMELVVAWSLLFVAWSSTLMWVGEGTTLWGGGSLRGRDTILGEDTSGDQDASRVQGRLVHAPARCVADSDCGVQMFEAAGTASDPT
eukprot:358497-Chlamydomonas_euryale.AAC.2